MEIIVAAADGAVLETITFILKEKVRSGITEIRQCSKAPKLAELFRKQPPEILIVFPGQITKAALSVIGLTDPERTAVIAVLPERAGDIVFKMQQYPVKWYLPERHLETCLNSMIERTGEFLKREREIRKYRIQHLYRIENEFKRIILAEFEKNADIREFKRFMRFFSRAGLHSCVLMLESDTWAFFCTDGSEAEVRRNILFMRRYFDRSEKNIRFAVSERIRDLEGFVSKRRLLQMILASAEGGNGKRIFYEADYRTWQRGNVRPAVYTACRYVEKNYAKKLRTGEIAEKCYISPNYLSEIFKKDMGIPLSAYIEQVRMEHAVRTLAEGEKLIKDIALICGFHSISYFSKRFKDIYGISPKKYRENEKTARSGKVNSIEVIL